MFVAALLPSSVADEIDTFLGPRGLSADAPGAGRAAGPAVRWTRREHWHLTLAFFGAVPPAQRESLEDAVAAAARRSQVVPVTLTGAGAFPSVGAARTLWLGVASEPAPELGRLAGRCRAQAARHAGIASTGQRFRGHLTIARSSTPLEATRWVRVLHAMPAVSWVVDELSLLESHLGQGPDGTPRYVEVASFPLSPR